MREVPPRVAALPPHVHRQLLAEGVREFRLPWREAGPLDHHDDKVDSAHCPHMYTASSCENTVQTVKTVQKIKTVKTVSSRQFIQIRQLGQTRKFH